MLALDVAALHAALDRKKGYQPWDWVATKARVTPSTLTRISHGGTPSTQSLIRLLAYLGTTDLAPFLTETPRTTSRAAPAATSGHRAQTQWEGRTDA